MVTVVTRLSPAVSSRRISFHLMLHSSVVGCGSQVLSPFVTSSLVTAVISYLGEKGCRINGKHDKLALYVNILCYFLQLDLNTHAVGVLMLGRQGESFISSLHGGHIDILVFLHSYLTHSYGLGHYLPNNPKDRYKLHLQIFTKRR